MATRRRYPETDTALGKGITCFAVGILVFVGGVIVGVNTCEHEGDAKMVTLEVEAPCHPGEVVLEATFPSVYYEEPIKDGIQLRCLDYGSEAGQGWHIRSWPTHIRERDHEGPIAIH